MRLATSVGGWHGIGDWRGTPTGRFVRHLLEMTAAMVLGMVVLGAAFREVHLLVFGSGFDQAWHRHVELTAFAMAFNMTLPMVAWMRHRGHSWERAGEMAAAMFVPALVLLVLFWLGVISAHAVLPVQMALMLPSMILVMLYRVDEYSASHLVATAGVRALDAGPAEAVAGTEGVECRCLRRRGRSTLGVCCV